MDLGVVLRRQHPARVRLGAAALAELHGDGRAPVGVEAVEDGHGVGHVERRHVVVGHLVDGRHERAQRVAVRHEQHGPVRALEERRLHEVLEAIEHAALAVRERLRPGRRRRLVVGVALVQRRRRAVHGPLPLPELRDAEARDEFRVVLEVALQRAVVALVEAPVALDPVRGPGVLAVARHGRERELAGLVRALELGSERDVDAPRGEAPRAQQLARGDGLDAAAHRQRDVAPAGEARLGAVPLARAVAQEDERRDVAVRREAPPAREAPRGERHGVVAVSEGPVEAAPRDGPDRASGTRTRSMRRGMTPTTSSSKSTQGERCISTTLLNLHVMGQPTI